MILSRALLRASLLLLLAPARLVAQQPTSAAERAPAAPNPPGIRHEIIRGRVTDDSGKAIVGATVTVTMAPDRSYRQDSTKADGRYVIDFPNGSGDYLLHVAAVGMKTVRKRITRNGPDSVYVEDVTLTSSVQKLAAVKVEAEAAPKPGRNEGFGERGPGAVEHESEGVNGQVSPDQEGNLAAVAATIPGVATTPGGISVLGLGSGQNNTTLNGMAFGGADIPRDAHMTTRVATSSYDPTRGWFSGAQTSVELSQGNVFASRTAHVTLDAPALQAGDAISQRLGGQFTNVQLSVGGDGSVRDDRYAYNYGMQGGRRYSDYVSLGSADADVLQHAGVAADSVSRFLQLLQQQGVPITSARVPDSRATENLSFIGRIDVAPYDWKAFTPARRTIGLLGYAKYSQSDALSSSPLATAAHSGRQTQAIASRQALFSSYWGSDYLTDIRTGLSLNDDRTTPYLRLPDGRVLVASDFTDGTGGLAGLQFGGNAGLEGRTRAWTWESTMETQFYAKKKRRHRIKLSADSRLDGIAQSLDGNRLGSFAYNSLGDFAARKPSSYARTLSAPDRTGGEWNGFVALADYMRVSQKFQLLYGARLEGNAFTQRPTYNPAVEQAFGARNDAAPASLHLSPRVGFTYIGGDPRGGYMYTPLGHFNFHPMRYLRGGFGEFRNMLSPALLADASAATGLPGAAQRIACVGSAVPQPDWGAYLADPSTIPTTCANGAPSTLVDAAPGVELFARDYRPARSWRANLAYSSSWKSLTYDVQGIYSLNLDQPGVVDLNFANTQQFTLPDEADRPVFVAPSDVVTATGAVSPVSGRRNTGFAAVMQHVSDLRSVSRQLTFTLSPLLKGFKPYYFSASYTLADVRQQQRGFDGATFASPTLVERGPGDFDVRHQFLLQGGLTWHRVALTLFGRLQSGMPFTPIVGGDINGDGLANDRAFIFQPADAPDSSVRAGMASLLANAPANVRDCLTRQFGSAAARNSCRTPWTSALNMQISAWGGLFHMPRMSVVLNFTNPLGGLDQLLHGDDLHGWGTAGLPDPVLLRPRGFDANARRFSYEVNPRFGDTRPSRTVMRAPFRVTLDVRLDVGRSMALQQLDKWLRPGRAGRKGPRLSADELKQRYSRNVRDPYRDVIEETDSLLLTRDQVEALQAAQQAYLHQQDTLWTSLTDYLASLGDEYDAKEALKRQEDATDAAWEIARQSVHESLPRILTPVQLKLLPWPAGMLLEAKEPVHIRMFGG